MPYKRSAMRYAHINGFTHCCYSVDGKKMLSCGADGDIRTWEGIDDDDPHSKCVGEFALHIVQHDERIFVSNDLNTVQILKYPDADRDGSAFRFTAAVTCIKVNKDYVIACSEDTIIKVSKIEGTEIGFDLEGHEGPVIRIDISCKNVLASSSGDGTIKIWDLAEQKCIKTIHGFDKLKSFFAATQYLTPSFEPKTGKYMAYNKNDEIVILDTENWATKVTLKDCSLVKPVFTVCEYSPDGLYIAAGTMEGDISIWDIKNNKVISGDSSAKENYRITAITWNPTNNGELAYCDDYGQLGTIIDCFQMRDEDENSNDVMNELIDDIDNNKDLENYLLDNSEDENNENCVSLKKLKDTTLKTEDVPVNLVTDIEHENTRPYSAEPRIKQYEIQSSFQPGASPYNLEHRYLVWNNVGIVRAHNTDKETSIDVEFHDVSTHYRMHLDNYLNHTMASLSSTVLALSGETPSKLVCIILGAGGNREWSKELPDCEETICLAATTNIVAVATDARNVRLFSPMGIQREIISIPGPIISLTGITDKLMIVYHNGPASKDQHLSAMILKINGMQLNSRDIKIPITPGSKLIWIGYSDRGSPCSYDTSGTIRMYNIASNLWYPICQTADETKQICDSIYIVEICESKQIIRGIICRGQTYPLITPRPIVIEMKMLLPMCNIESEQTILEEHLIRLSHFAIDDSETILKETAIKLFAMACRTEKEARAKELIQMLASPSLLTLAVKYASKLGRMHFVEKLRELLPQFAERELQKQQQQHQSESELWPDMSDFHDLASSNIFSSANTSLLSTKGDKTPTIIPKPILVSQPKRNPFKKSLGTPNSSFGSTLENPLSHLTEKAIGFKNPTSDSPSIDITGNDEVKTPNKKNFMTWFKENKTDLESENPNVTPVELTKIGMKKFKGLNTQLTDNEKISKKRKLTDEIAINEIENGDGKSKTAGVNKLAKFGFSKN